MRAFLLAATVFAATGLATSCGALAAGKGHGHGNDVMREPAPSVALEVSPDPAVGYNLHIVTSKFRFSPENTGRPTEEVGGHVHPYVNGMEKARVYGPWHHMPDHWSEPGANTLRVALNDNVHAVWAAEGEAVGAEVVLTGAGTFDGEEISETLTLDQVRTIGVTQGADVRLVLHSETALDLHFHGYDLTATAGPAAPAIFTFRAEHVGRFPIEAHGVTSVLGHADKALAYVEVRPE